MKISLKSVVIFSSSFFILYAIDTYFYLVKRDLIVPYAYYLRIFEFLLFLTLTILLLRRRGKRIKSDESVSYQLKKLKKNLKESETRFQSLVSNIPGVTFRCSCIDWKMTLLSIEMENLSGFEADLFLGDNSRLFESIIHPDDVYMLRNKINHAVEMKENFNVEYRIIHKNGEVKWVYEKGLGIFDDDGNLLYLDGVIVDISELKNAEQHMKILKSYLQSIIDSMPSAIIGTDSSGRVTLWNEKTEKLTGVTSESAITKPLGEVFLPIDHEIDYIHKVIAEKKELRFPRRVYEKDGESRYEELTIFPLNSLESEGVVFRIDDVTEKYKLEEVLVQNEKMLSVGGLAAGLAHEINNPLGGMLQTASVMSNRLGKTLNMKANIEAAEKVGITIESISQYMERRDIFNMLDTINISGQRIALIVSDILGFAGKDKNVKSTYNVVELIEASLNLAATDFDLKKEFDFQKIKIDKEYEPNIPQIICNKTGIQQVVLNILRNGTQVMENIKNDSPCFTITTKFDSTRNMVSISIADNGPGMPEDVRKRVFEPFYTTKPEGLGTGLGLSVSYFIIVENHRGELLVESRMGHGTRFIINIPLNQA